MSQHALLPTLTAAAFAAGLSLAGVPAAPAAPASAGGTTYVVTRTDDPADTGACDSDCSLREAVIAANSDPNIDTIVLHSGSTYLLSVVGPGDAQQGDLDITHSVDFTITDGTADASIDGNGLTTGDRVLQIVAGETQLHRVDIANGVAPSDGGSPAHHFGGGIAVNPAAALDLYDDHVYGNSAPFSGDQGGGIYNNGGRVFLSHVLMSQNHADAGFGGAVETTGTNAATTILNSKLVRNAAEFGGALDDSGGLTAVENTQLGSNNAGAGGAVFGGFSGSGQTTFINVTANDNEASGAAQAPGGVARIVGGTLYVKNSTLSNNRSTDGGALSVGNPFALTPAPDVTLADSIVAGNQDTDPSDGSRPNCANPEGGLMHSAGYNLIGNADGCGIIKTTGDQFGSSLVPIDAGLAGTNPDANGGPQLTYALEPNSAARDAGDPAAEDGCEPVDARGIQRTLGGRCDIGAYELVTCGSSAVDIVGTNQADPGTLDGAATSGADAFTGQGGDDSFAAGGGDDALCGGAGADRLLGGGGADRLYGGTGDDVLKGGPGNDHLDGGPGNHDVCVSGGGHDTAVRCETKRGF